MVGKIRVLIVDDSAFSRQSLKGMMEEEQAIEVVGIATNGIDAMAKTVRLKPDVITLDFEMPEMDGFSFLRWLMKERPTPVVMVTSYADSRMVFEALELGAVDFVAKPSKNASVELRNIRDDLLAKIRGISDLKMDRLNISRQIVPEMPDSAKGPDVLQHEESPEDIGIVAIGSSTGGPTALELILKTLPATLPAPILISQHMPKGFTHPFAVRLSRLARIKVKEAADGDIVEGGKALICPGGHHMTLKREDKTIRVALKEATNRDKYIPSVDMMMMSAAEHFKGKTMGVILTGMGSDGKLGVVEIKKKGGYTIAEAESTAVIFGMPGEAIKTGTVDRILPLYKIPKEIIMAFTGGRNKTWKRN
jgi:two-component system chemotaxis response regulator CheB